MVSLSSPVRLIRRHPWWTAVAVIVGVPILLVIFLLTRPKTPTYVTDTAKVGTLTRTVQAVGAVTSDRDLKLSFPSAGIVLQVYVREGQHVHAGQTLAALRSADLAASVNSQAANVEYLQAQLQLVQEGNRAEDIAIAQAQLESARAGSRPEDIAIAQADVDSKQASLDAAQTSLQNATAQLAAAGQHLDVIKQQEQTSLAGQVLTARSTVQQQLVTAEDALGVMIGVINDVKVQDALNQQNPHMLADILAARNDELMAIQSLKTKVNVVSDPDAAIQLFQDAHTEIAMVASTLDQAYSLLSSLQETAYFTNSVRETDKAAIATQRTAVQSGLASLDSQFKSLQDAAASFTTQIATEQSTIVSATGTRDKAKADIGTFQAALLASKAQLALKRAGPRPQDIAVSQAQLESKKAPPRQADVAAAAARVRQAQAELERAQAQFANTLLTAPVEGIVTKVTAKAGETAPAGASVELLGDAPYRIEMYAAEVDVPKIAIGQDATVTLDAFPEKPFALTVSQIDPAPTVVEGANKYRVRLDFVYPHPELKLGMTGDSTIVTGTRKDVIVVPFRAVIENKEKKKVVRVLQAGKVMEKPVMTGMESDTDVEIVSGLKAGEIIILLVK